MASHEGEGHSDWYKSEESSCKTKDDLMTPASNDLETSLCSVAKPANSHTTMLPVKATTMLSTAVSVQQCWSNCLL